MKLICILLMALASAVGAAQAQQDFVPDAPPSKRETVKYTLLTPADKTFELVKAEERNPFAKLDDGKGNPSDKAVSEENKIRDRLEKLRVVGVSPGERGLRVMLGDIVLESGQMVPPLLPEQSVALRVGSISAQAIELIWLEERSDDLPARKLTIPVDLRPNVRYHLKGIPTNKNQWEKEKADSEKVPVGRLFPDVSKKVGDDEIGQNSPVPRAVPVDEPHALATLPAEAPRADPSTAQVPPPAAKGGRYSPNMEAIK